jgi:hypothetical protein
MLLPISVLACALTLLQEQPPAKKGGDDKWEVAAAHGPVDVVEFDTDEGTWMSCDVSPDGKEIVFDLLGDLYLMPIAGGERARARDRTSVRGAAALQPGREAHLLHQRPRRRRQHLGDGP